MVILAMAASFLALVKQWIPLETRAEYLIEIRTHNQSLLGEILQRRILCVLIEFFKISFGTYS